MNADTRIFGAVNKNDETISCEIKGLAVREKEIVVSNVQFSENWSLVKGTNASSVIEKISFHPEQELTQDDIKVFFETEIETDDFNWEVKNLITGEVISQAPPAQ